jgi:dihydrofolate reductase
MISMISAIGRNNEIGKNNDLLWNMPADMKHFRETTSGKTVIMGQKTFESLGKGADGTPGRPLPNRRNIILTQDKNWKRNDIEIVFSIDDLMTLLKETTTPDEEVFVIGGGTIYRLMMEKADRLYITHVDASFPDADIFFPEIVPIVWNEISHEEHKKDDKNPFNYTFSIYERFI